MTNIWMAIIVAGLPMAPRAIADSVVDEPAIKATLYDFIEKDTLKVAFDKGNSNLNSSATKEIVALLESVRGETKINRVIVAAWADKDYPDSKTAELNAKDIRLANDRAANVRKVIRDTGIRNVDTYTMTSRPSWIAKTFNSSEAQLKGEGKLENREEIANAEIGQKIRAKGGPSTAVVMIIREGSAAAH